MRKLTAIYGAAMLGLFLSAAPVQAETTSISKLMGMGQNVTCTYEKTDADGTQRGTFYLAGQKMRGEVQVASVDGAYPMNILRDGDWQYLWGGPLGETQGMKMSTTAPRSGRSPHGQHGPDVNEEMDYQCQPWSVDASKFQVPQNVQFMDMAQMVPPGMAAAMSGVQGGTLDMHAIHCSACDQAPEAERAECKQMMGC